MTAPHSEAIIFFGATGDLAYKKIFPALQAMIRRGHLNVPIIGIASSTWNRSIQSAGQGQPRKAYLPCKKCCAGC
jgi:glucose-6-phosphate 1-dehydrogenase